jgi:limonene 1,2-monooxygenase
MTDVTLKHGLFLAPYHPMDESPTVLFQKDFELIEWVERLGYQEVWVGEHHSAGYEMIASPELFIAAAAERTKRIRFGTGVVSLSYHNPLMVANRMIQLDHMTQGRIMFGAGPGLLVSDAEMLGIDPSTIRDRLSQSLDVILRLFRGECVTEKTDWYNLVNARAHLLPYQKPYPEVAVASASTPSGGRLAGKYGLAMLCFVADRGSFNALTTNWAVANEIAAEHGNVMNPDRLRLVGPMHIAETREQARENVRKGFQKYMEYFFKLHPQRYVIPAGTDPIDWFIENKIGVIGTPDDAIAEIKRLQDKQGPFGYYCQTVHDWADWEQTKKSYELYARFVMPHFHGSNVSREASLDWVAKNAIGFDEKRDAAAAAMFAQHEAERRKLAR